MHAQHVTQPLCGGPTATHYANARDMRDGNDDDDDLVDAFARVMRLGTASPACGDGARRVDIVGGSVLGDHNSPPYAPLPHHTQQLGFLLSAFDDDDDDGDGDGDDDDRLGSGHSGGSHVGDIAGSFIGLATMPRNSTHTTTNNNNNNNNNMTTTTATAAAAAAAGEQTCMVAVDEASSHHLVTAMTSLATNSVGAAYSGRALPLTPERVCSRYSSSSSNSSSHSNVPLTHAATLATQLGSSMSANSSATALYDGSVTAATAVECGNGGGGNSSSSSKNNSSANVAVIVSGRDSALPYHTSLLCNATQEPQERMYMQYMPQTSSVLPAGATHVTTGQAATTTTMTTTATTSVLPATHAMMSATTGNRAAATATYSSCVLPHAPVNAHGALTVTTPQLSTPLAVPYAWTHTAGATAAVACASDHNSDKSNNATTTTNNISSSSRHSESVPQWSTASTSAVMGVPTFLPVYNTAPRVNGNTFNNNNDSSSNNSSNHVTHNMHTCTGHVSHSDPTTTNTTASAAAPSTLTFGTQVMRGQVGGAAVTMLHPTSPYLLSAFPPQPPLPPQPQPQLQLQQHFVPLTPSPTLATFAHAMPHTTAPLALWATPAQQLQQPAVYVIGPASSLTMTRRLTNVHGAMIGVAAYMPYLVGASPAPTTIISVAAMPSSSSPTAMMPAATALSAATAGATTTAATQLLQQQQQQQPQVPQPLPMTSCSWSSTTPSAMAASMSPFRGSNMPAMVLPIFVQMFPCELRDRVGVLNRVIEATCGAEAGIVLSVEPRSETSLIAYVQTRSVWWLIFQLRCRVLMDRHGFWYARSMDEYRHMKRYCEGVRRLPQQTRHFQTDGLPCMPLVVELSRSFDRHCILHTPAPPCYDEVEPIASLDRRGSRSAHLLVSTHQLHTVV